MLARGNGLALTHSLALNHSHAWVRLSATPPPKKNVDNDGAQIHKTVWRIKKGGVKKVGLQFPEGLLMYSCAIADILEKFAGVEHTVILGDTTFGACCVDDFSAKAMEVRPQSKPTSKARRALFESELRHFLPSLFSMGGQPDSNR